MSEPRTYATPTITVTVRDLYIVELLLEKLRNASDQEAQYIRGGLRAFGFRIEDLKGRGGDPYGLEYLQLDIDSGKIAIRVDGARDII